MSSGKEITFAKDEIIFQQGENPNGLYHVKEGLVEIFNDSEGEEIILDTIKEGEVLGTFTLVFKMPRTASARAATKCVLIFYSEDLFRKTIEQAPPWLLTIMKDSVLRLQKINSKFIHSKLNEKILNRNLGSIFHHCAQFMFLLSMLIQKSQLNNLGENIVYPFDNFLENAERILLKRRIYLDHITHIFVNHGLFQLSHKTVYGTVLLNPDVNLFEEFARGALSMAKNGVNALIPVALFGYIDTLFTLSKKEELVTSLTQEKFEIAMGAHLHGMRIEYLLDELESFRLIKIVDNYVYFSGANLKKMRVFHGIFHDLFERKK